MKASSAACAASRHTQHPLPHRARAEHVLHQMPRTLGHAPRAAAWAEPALLAGKRHQPFGMAVRARDPQESVREHGAAQVRGERLAYIRGQRAVLHGQLREQVRKVRLHQGAQQRALGRVVRVGWCGGLRGRCSAGGVRRRALRRRGVAQPGALLRSDGCTLSVRPPRLAPSPE